MNQQQIKYSRTSKLASLFIATALVVGGSGCTNTNNCVDNNGDGQCDNTSSGGAGYYGSTGGSSGRSTTTTGGSTGISEGSHGGIGSSGHSSS